jgi:hypothetical protein
MIAAVALGLVAAVAMALRRRQERSILEGWAARHGWTLETAETAEMPMKLAGSVLLQIGHSRRFSAIAGDPQGVRLFEYACETGFEHEREQHHWVGVVVPVEHDKPRATFTREDWAIALAVRPGFEQIVLGDSVAAASDKNMRIALVEDAELWRVALASELGKRLTAEASARTWEVIPGALVGFEAAPRDESSVTELASAGKEIARLL